MVMVFLVCSKAARDQLAPPSVLYVTWYFVASGDGFPVCHYAAVDVRVYVVPVFRLHRVYVARDVQVVVVGVVVYLAKRNHARVAGQLDAVVEGVHNLVDVALAQTVLVAVLHEALAGVNHEDAAASARVFLVHDDDAGRYAGAVEQVRRQPDDALDEAAPD